MTFARSAAVVAFAAVAALACAPRAEATAFTIDPYHSQTIILVDHYGVARIGGMIGGLEGSVEFDPEKGTDWLIDATIPVFNFISTHPPRTEAVKGPQLLDASNHPDIKFKSSSVQMKDGGATVTGELMIRGITKEVTFPMSVRGPRPDPLGATRVGLEGEIKVSRAAFGLPFDRKMSDDTPVLGDEVTILFQIEAIQVGKILRDPNQSKQGK